MKNRFWFPVRFGLFSDSGLHRLERKYGSHKALSLWLRTLSHLYRHESIDWNDSDERDDLCYALREDEDTVLDFIHDCCKLGWLDREGFTQFGRVASRGVLKQIEREEELRAKRKAAIEKRWEKHRKKKAKKQE